MYMESFTCTRWVWKAIKRKVNSDPSIYALSLACDDLKMVLRHNKVKLFGDVCVEVLKNVVLGSAQEEMLHFTVGEKGTPYFTINVCLMCIDVYLFIH